jgi:hypothetical protein
MSVSDDTKELALCAVDTGTLVELKGVNRSWGTLARHMLCMRLCCRTGKQQPPQQLSHITDLDIESLARADRLWEVAAAGRLLPSLARLHGFGFEVNVAAVRAADLTEKPPGGHDEDDEDDEDDEEDAHCFGGTALHSCITGEGQPDLELLLAAVACAGSGKIWGVPVEQMRKNEIGRELDLCRSMIGAAAGAQLLGLLLPGATSIKKLK